MFAAPPVIETEVFARLPDELRILDSESPWTIARGGGPLHSFLEGPSFDLAGNLYCVDLCHSRIFRIDAAGTWHVFAAYDGGPNGLKVHRDGRIFVADAKLGLLCFDPLSANVKVIVDSFDGKKFGGLNDLVFADNGDIYFTDPGSSAYENPIGRVFRLDAAGKLDLIADRLPYPNGLVLDDSQDFLFVALTRSLQVIRIQVRPKHGAFYKSGVFLQMSGGLAGPDGMALDEAGNLAVVHAGFGSVWLFSVLGEPVARVRSCTGIRTTNVAYGGTDGASLYVTEAAAGVILRAQMPTPGRRMFSHR